MGLVAGSASREYWSPPNPQNMRVVPPPPGAVCRHCGADYAPGARFCHLCGDGRDSRAAAQPGVPETENRRYWLGLPAKCRAFFLLGLACMLCAALTGVIYKAHSLMEWQAIQTWRIEWLLAAAAALLAGILLK